MERLTTYNEQDLLRRVSEGNEIAFRQLFDAYNKKLFSFAEEMLKSAADAEEVVQEVFTKVWINRDQFSHVENSGQYLYRMVRNRTDWLSCPPSFYMKTDKRYLKIDNYVHNY